MGKPQKAPGAGKVEAKKPSTSLPKSEVAPPPPGPPVEAEPVSPVIVPALTEEILRLLSPPPATVPIQPAPAPKPVAPAPVAPLEPVQPPQPVQQAPIIKAPLVIQPEDEPPRRPIPIVRVPRSKQNPNGNGRGSMAESNGHDISAASPPSLEPLATAAPLPPAPRPRPKPVMRPPRLEEEPPAPRPVMRTPRVQIEEPQNFAPISQPAMAEEPYSDEADSAWDHSPWMTEPRPRLRFRFQLGSRLGHCLAYEAVAILVLIAAVLVGLSHRTSDDPLNLITRVLAVGAAIMAAIIPVLFYGLPERFPRDPR